MERVDLVTEAERLVAAAQEHGVVARMLGGVAVAMRCPTARTEPWCSPGPAPSTFPTARTTG